MQIQQIRVTNFRLLKDFSIDLEKELSLIIGKNNVGKTSLLLVLDKFLGENKNKFKFNDFNLDFQDELQKMMESPKVDEEVFNKCYSLTGITMRIIIKYNDDDDLSKIGNTVLMDLDEEKKFFTLGFDYTIDYESYCKMYDDFQIYKEKYSGMDIGTSTFFSERIEQNKYFKIRKKSIAIDRYGVNIDESNFIDLDKKTGFSIDDIISFQYIGARRDVANKESDHTLSQQTSDLYEYQNCNEDFKSKNEDFLEKLRKTDESFSESYKTIFKDIIDKIKQFGGMSPNETEIKIVSTLQHRELLKDNTTVVYTHDTKKLSESFNGLGYMNLISMIFDLNLKIKKFENKTSVINLLFIEEPEAHTHPQMQYIFIKNIKDLLSNKITAIDGSTHHLQYLISSHSAHIVSASNFDDIKYFRKENGNIKACNLSELNELYKNKNDLKFLKQYLTVNRSELFFADKAICFEGDTERILLPVMMKKYDFENRNSSEVPLMSQNISLIEVGAHADIFSTFFNFIGLSKLLIITDFDCCQKNNNNKDVQAQYVRGNKQTTSNAAIKYFMQTKDSDVLSDKDEDDKIFLWDEKNEKMINDKDKGNVMLCYQVKEGNYQPRSFEDDFFALNASFRTKKYTRTAILKKSNSINTPYEYAECIQSKASMAVEILINSEEPNEETFKYSDWEIPTYIKQGLSWLRK